MLEPRVGELEKQIRFLRTYAILTSLVVVILAFAGFSRNQSPDVIRTRGIIVEDSLGRERILIGAPIPNAENRVRTDMDRVADVWGRRFPQQYMDEWYPDYRHDMNGMLVLDANGFDRLALGQDVPDPNIGKRIARGTGMLINDSLGFERSGYSLLTVNGEDRIVLGLDNNSGEALTLVVDDAGRIGFSSRDGGNSIDLGTLVFEDSTGTSHSAFGLQVRGNGGEVHRITVNKVP